MRDTRYKFRSGFTLTELAITMTIAPMLVLVVGVLLVSGQRSWHQTYNSAHKQIKQDAQTVMIKFGSMGRRANRLGYRIYEISGDSFTPAVPQTSDPQEVVFGKAVEFRYWDVELDEEDTHDLMDVEKEATAYVLFYLDGSELKVDYGPYPPGAVPAGGGNRNTFDITTIVLAENVSTDDDDYGGDYDSGGFSHTTVGGVGQGCVRINITLTDPDDGETIKVMTATLMRNIWPR